ncbi:hypothetical protein TIFTF001_013701 [Ficus carica]|uniref:Late embryogenesis abundant protein LEA-2 subgroup domain-containing protein n=1 Tax=Ficus carica TaxID=3494 RepID=A0AA88A3Y0_FICCA|nr:hypothetical protein TIFTF001_013701 [Ficus carica]
MVVEGMRTPKVRLRSVSVENLNVISSSNSPSFSLKLNARLTVKNTNFGPYKFDNSKVIVSYRGTQVGEATIFKSRAKLQSTKKFNVTVSLNSNEVSSNSQLGSDVNSKNLTFNARAKLNGKVHVLGVFKKKNSAEMDCTFVVNTSTKVINDLSCK